ncbi:MAG: biopolymer transporter ExbD [Bacteriovoracaceae bacterium]|nr:biopolymer transporter ExbD [Bacteriovoracaceae bacterium]
MSRNRSIRNRGRSKVDSNNGELNITSLLDILTFLLISLLANYNYSGQVVNIPGEIKIPRSTSLESQKSGVAIQVSTQKIWVDDRLVLDLTSADSINKIIYDEGGRRVVPLYAELVKIRDEISVIKKQVEAANDFSGRANLVVDEKLKYDDLRKIMYTCASAGFKEFNFLVLSEK